MGKSCEKKKKKSKTANNKPADMSKEAYETQMICDLCGKTNTFTAFSRGNKVFTSCLCIE